MAKNRIFKFSCLFTLLSFNSRRYKKCISPVVATALLLVVAVVAVIGFQNWVLMYSANVFTGVETSSYNDVSSFLIETVVGNVLYLKNIGSDFTIKDIKIDGVSCYDNDTVYEKGIFEIDVSLCLDNVSSYDPEILIVTDKGLVEKKIYYKPRPKTCSIGGITLESQTSQTFYKYNKPYNSMSGCSAISQERTCSGGVLSGTNEYSYLSCNDSLAPTQGGEWVLVFANEDLGVNNDFYVMKYEAKFVNTASKTQDATRKGWRYDTAGGDLSIRSHPTPEPITYITQTQAISSCSSLGAGYKLITRAEWVTTAREAENNTYNWNTSEIYSGSMYRGHSDSEPSHALLITDVNDGYIGTGQSGTSEQRRTLKLYNGEIIWDLGGNVWEWNSDVYNTNAESSLGQGTSNWYEWTSISSSYNHFKPYNTSLTSSNRIGQVYADVDNAHPSGTIHAFLSGGYWHTGASAGSFTLDLSYAPSGLYSYLGFRCSYDP